MQEGVEGLRWCQGGGGWRGGEGGGGGRWEVALVGEVGF